MRYSTKQSLGIILVAAVASLVMQAPAVVAKVIEHNEPAAEVIPTMSPTPTEPVVVPTFIPPRMQTPDPQNPDNGGNVGGGFIGRNPEDKPACEITPTRCRR